MNTSAEYCEDKTLDFYIQFTRLKAEDFGQIMLSASDIYNGLLNLYFHETGIQIDDKPSLELFKVQTGDSIKFCFTEGWLPKVHSDKEHDIIIGTPKKLGIPLLIGYLLLCSVEKIIDVENKHLDGQIKKLELRLKQEEINKLKEKADSKAFQELQKKSDRLVYALLMNTTFTEITINNTLIKNKHFHKDRNKDIDDK
jgi:hypothetical protein